MSHMFVSYLRENEASIERLCHDLRGAGIEVWRDREQIRPGQRWQQVIRQAIQSGAFFLACFSQEYTTREKSYMNEELTLAIEELRKRPTDRAWFIPVLLSDCQVPDRDIGAGETLRALQWVPLWKDWHDGVKRIISVVGIPPNKRAIPNEQKSPAPKSALALKMGLSDQAIFILRQFVESGDDQFFFANFGGGQWALQLCHGEQNQLGVTEPRFIDDDLRDLVARRLLTVEYNADGHGIYGVTRAAVRFIQALGPADESQ